jgi:excisionase family DNA binding protein
VRCWIRLRPGPPQVSVRLTLTEQLVKYPIDRHSGNGRRADARSKGPVAVEPRDRLITPTEVADMFRVDPRTVSKWASSGRLKGIRTPGGQWRFRESEVRAVLQETKSG